MTETFRIAGYTRISVDDEIDRDNVSIENQKAIIEDFVKTQFPSSSLTFFEDRDRSGYTFEQREGYQEMRRQDDQAGRQGCMGACDRAWRSIPSTASPSCERKSINRTEKGRNHAVSLFFSIFYDISNELRSTDFP